MRWIVLIVPFLAGCASAGTPLDLIWPTVVPIGVESYLEHDVPALGSITTLSILRVAQQEIELKHLLNEMEYTGASKSASFVIQATENMQGDILAGLAAIGLGTAGIGIPIARKAKRKGDFSKEEMDAERQRVGNMEPVEFKKEG